ncbi:NAD(P)-dependent oxidoreductase [Dictyobacter kobayashii]|uniref:Oxidoreductase n=1 Tax=Dictyobacter kobayashii TaxID=2014872 RepID=A0A402AR30_9CHLR|nr:NAD(P)H-binding protein [Dictyobacter kobayashii]GCE21547.1 oxidoreductase [Dictyobacter kobayashii]
MHILLLGATGRVGSHVIEYALAADLHVTALARQRSKIQTSSPNLTVVEGDIQHPQAFIDQLQQQSFDVLINVVGGDVFKPSTVVTDSVKAALAAVRQLQIPRYLGITGVAEMPACGLGGSITAALLRRSPIRHAVHDHDNAFALVKETADMDWVLAGCPYIRDGRHTASYKVVPGCFPGGFKLISPEDVADFLTREAREQRYSRQIVGIWN